MNPAPSNIPKMYSVYLLKSIKKGSFYIGYTNNIMRRIHQHNLGLIGYTKKSIPWNLIYCENFLSLEDAKLREKHLKYFGKTFTQLQKRIKNSLNPAPLEYSKQKINKNNGAGLNKKEGAG